MYLRTRIGPALHWHSGGYDCLLLNLNLRDPGEYCSTTMASQEPCQPRCLPFKTCSKCSLRHVSVGLCDLYFPLDGSDYKYLMKPAKLCCVRVFCYHLLFSGRRFDISTNLVGGTIPLGLSAIKTLTYVNITLKSLRLPVVVAMLHI
jgi:hypothetical protein